MDKEEIKRYTARVAQANRSELVVIIYELLLSSMEEAQGCYAAGDVTGGEENIHKAQEYLQELKGSLDHQYPLAGQLYQLYRYVNEQLITTKLRQKPVNFESAQEVVRGLLDSFSQIAPQDTSGPVWKDSQQVYAGLTYGRGAKGTVYVEDPRGHRGYQA